ncbi:MAG TPA: thermonuclease family protein [Cyclobacteriaceae bacterium]|nr:thermonuclease family protein [Cyclobacteriaceae bacterium]
MKNLIFIIYLIVLHFPSISQISGTVTYVSDGDTFHLITESGNKIKVRVADIDCPESTQEYGLEAKQFTNQAIKGKQVALTIKQTDRYGRKVAFVTYDGKDLSQQLLKHGLAWHYKRYSILAKYAQMEDSARYNKIGLWQSKNPMAPWDYRKNN